MRTLLGILAMIFGLLGMFLATIAENNLILVGIGIGWIVVAIILALLIITIEIFNDHFTLVIAERKIIISQKEVSEEQQQPKQQSNEN